MTFLTLSSRPWLLNPSSSFTISIKTQTPVSVKLPDINSSRCSAAKQQTGNSVKKRSNSRNNSKKRGSSKTLVDIDSDEPEGSKGSRTQISPYQPAASLPKPPAGFVLDANGDVVMVSQKRMVTIVDTTNNSPLECIIRRVFKSSQGDDCMLLCPVDTPVQMLKNTDADGWSAASDDEVEAILPAAAYALAKIHMHLVYSGFCYTARGGFCYSEEDIFEFGSDDGQVVDGLPTEGVRITCFYQDGTPYMIYTPSDPLLFVAVKDKDGILCIADDDLLEDPATVDAIDEETEFNALVEEEDALLESLLEEDEQ